ncbi:eukaryotic translation initiation factor 3 subunit M-like isoform X2 [Cucumis melo var. makuwa]|uniref:Eukaryotic translation initiation factor 3 subunit M-like isoform X2 n=1 Tax=Cucumis melo var. makuwa TaxID=1194695 RepID=A0A5A7VBJ9_CUCMM|nr:eukaryotic translation initiation factor 3 subunit M-like isoform X2 [Cucumis melo var. makuwa]
MQCFQIASCFSLLMISGCEIHLGGWKWEPLFSHSTKLEPIEEVTIKGLIGCRNVFSSDTRGTGFMHLTFLSSFSSDVGMYSLSYGGDYITHGLVHEDCIAKMRLLSLVDLGSNESARIPYALIKGVTCVLLVLQINDDEVELWVVKAITSKLIDCKMDQMNEVVIFEEDGGVDLIVVYNSGRFRMAGRGSLAVLDITTTEVADYLIGGVMT